ncbi:MAG: DegT/DnrJ/EryC1/StrS family aminotransferase, partial [Candidatus Kapaibacterium sp.]
VNFRSINRLTYYKTHFDVPNGTFPNAERIGDSTITLPLYTLLEEAEIDYVIAQTKEVVHLLNESMKSGKVLAESSTTA